MQTLEEEKTTVNSIDELEEELDTGEGEQPEEKEPSDFGELAEKISNDIGKLPTNKHVRRYFVKTYIQGKYSKYNRHDRRHLTSLVMKQLKKMRKKAK